MTNVVGDNRENRRIPRSRSHMKITRQEEELVHNDRICVHVFPDMVHT